MSPAETSLERIVAELAPLVGARIQRVDVVAPREVVLELRVPGRTLRLLVSARPGLGGLALVPRRPTRVLQPGQLQAILRSRLVGQALLRIEAEGSTVRLGTRRLQVEVRTRGGKSSFTLTDFPAGLPDRIDEGPIPDRFPLAEAAGDAHAIRAPALREEALRSSLMRSVKARRRKLSRLAARLEGDLSKLASYEDARSDGELLKSELHRVKRGDRAVEVTDWATMQTRTVPLDPTLGPKENLERLFGRAKKATRGLPRVRAKLESVRQQLAAVDEERLALESADEAALARFAEAWGEGEAGKGPAAKRARAHPLDKWSRRFTAKDGATIRVGKGAQANDRLTFSGAKGADVWLHARGVTGAHVVISSEAGKPPSAETLLDAAHLAVHYSTAKNEAKAEVIHTEVRHVKKTKGAPAGQVGVSKSKTLLVRMESARLDRLLGRGEG